MKTEYDNGPCIGGAISAEEFAATLEQGFVPCAEERTEERSGGCGRKPRPVEEGCCCKKSFRAALELLAREELNELLDLEQVVFITEDYVAGAAVAQTVADEGPADNLVAPLTGSIRRFAPCTCDLLEITADLYAAPGTATGITATEVSLCRLTAVAVQLAAVEALCCLTEENMADRNFRRVRQILARNLETEEGGVCACRCSDDCCCASGIKGALEDGAISRRVTLAAGALLLRDVRLLGTVGNVLVLANEADERIYFVCAANVQFLA